MAAMQRIAIFLTLSLFTFPACDDGTGDTESNSETSSGSTTEEPKLRANNPFLSSFLTQVEGAHAEFRETGRIPRICVLSVCASCEESWVPTPGIYCKISTPTWGCSGHCGYVCSGQCWGK